MNSAKEFGHGSYYYGHVSASLWEPAAEAPFMGSRSGPVPDNWKDYVIHLEAGPEGTATLNPTQTREYANHILFLCSVAETGG